MNLLFVCVENSCRSQMAEAFARMLGHNQVAAHSAGSRPSGIINPRAIDSMHTVGYDLGAHRSKSVSELPDIEFDVAVTMGCGDECPTVRARHMEDWAIPDPKAMDEADFAQVREEIRARVIQLLERP